VLDELQPIAGRDEFLIENSKVDPFTCSEFEPLLRNLNRHVLILVGLCVNFGIEMTVRTASEKDYGACILSDCTDRLFGAYNGEHAECTHSALRTRDGFDRPASRTGRADLRGPICVHIRVRLHNNPGEFHGAVE
jgi:hypothetical protein